jgi:hypothetical protein
MGQEMSEHVLEVVSLDWGLEIDSTNITVPQMNSPESGTSRPGL